MTRGRQYGTKLISREEYDNLRASDIRKMSLEHIKEYLKDRIIEEIDSLKIIKDQL